MPDTPQSCIYTGWVRHRRFEPHHHSFKYPLFMCLLDCDELEAFFKSRWYCGYETFNWVSFRNRDYLKFNTHEQTNLKQSVMRTIRAHSLEHRLTPPDIRKIYILTHFRYLGFLFNPVSFYYCYDENNQLKTIVAEITNTPWLERHAYVMHIGQSHDQMQYVSSTRPEKSNIKHTFIFDKAFHISPFNPMGMHYRWNFLAPDDQCLVHMTCAKQQESSNHLQRHFDATLCMQRKPITEFGKTLLRFPAMSVSVVMGIYWQAFKLKLKRSPFYPHPNTLSQHADPTRPGAK